MSHMSELINENVYGYYADHAHRESDLLKSFREETLNYPGGDMLSSPEQCQFLGFLIHLTKAKSILEVGTFTGYGTLWMAQALPDNGEIITCDIDEKPQVLAKKYWEQSGLAQKITAKIGPAKEALEAFRQAGKTFDLIYIDADKQGYPEYYELSLDLLNSGGIIVLDNVLCFNQYVHEEKTAAAKTMSQLNKQIQQDDRVLFSMLPIGGGLTLVTKR